MRVTKANTAQGMVHVINGLGKISGAERAMLRVVFTQKQRPLTVVSLREVDRNHPALADWPDDIDLQEFHGPIGLIGATIRLAAFLARRPATTLLCWMYRSNIAGALATLFSRRHRLIWNVRHSLTRLEAEPVRVRLSIWLNRALSGRPQTIFYNSDRARSQHEAYGFPARKSLYVPNGFDPKPEPPPRQSIIPSGGDAGTFVIGHAGRMTWEKDIGTLIAAFAQAREMAAQKLKLVMVGSGYERANAQFQELLARHGVDDGSVEGCGLTDDMLGFFRDIDLFVMSSVSEGFPNVLAEAQMAARPCVTTDVGDASAIVSPEFGWVVPPEDPQSFAEAIVEAAMMDADQLSQFGQTAREQTVTQFSLASIVARYDAAGGSE
jgi:glycosyltransferase involved in cell wall biosynthesis